MLLCLPLPCTLSAADYRVPRAAYSMCTADLDGDGDNDIVVGHNYCVETGWEGISILINDGFGQFSLLDSLAFLFTWESDVEAYNLNSQSNSDIIALAYSLEQEIASLGIIYDCNLNSIVSYCLNVEWVDSVSGGDIDGDGFLDVVVSQSDGQFWGVLYNDGSGFLSEPVYYSVTGYEPSELACGDLNGEQDINEPQRQGDNDHRHHDDHEASEEDIAVLHDQPIEIGERNEARSRLWLLRRHISSSLLTVGDY